MGTTFKAVVMLTVVVGGPVAYLYHGPLPPQVRRVVDRVTTVAREMVGEKGDSGETPSDACPGGVCPGGACPIDAPTFAPPIDRPLAPPSLVVESSPAAAPTPAVDANSLQPLLDQLVQLGVGEYELTRWGSAGALYRFRCAAPLAGDLQHAQQFEAVGESPAASIEQVVAEVAAWRLARHDSRFTR
ncbi:MAG: hypothetical protein KDA44_06905 [Planctomycetales bacterium]|nr:hypothetical protein [Planctomycetales bacterium]